MGDFVGLEKPSAGSVGGGFLAGVAERTDNYTLKIGAGKDNFMLSALYKLTSADNLADRYCTAVCYINGELWYIESGKIRKSTMGDVITYDKANGTVKINGTMFEGTTYYTWNYIAW